MEDLFGSQIFEEDFSKEPLEKKIERALKMIRSFGRLSDEPIEVSYSGGKDSDVILELVRMSGIQYRAIYKNTGIDPPGTINHCIANNVEIVRKTTFAKVIQRKGFPTLKRRFCCAFLKEYKVMSRAVQGIRKSESVKRNRLYKEPVVCRIYRSKKNSVEVILPILYWSVADVEKFIEMRGLKCHPIYYDDNGNFHSERRLGCMGCPQKSDRGLADFRNNPKLVRFWLKNGEIWWNTHKLEKTKAKFNSHYEVFVRNVFFDTYQDFINATNNMFGHIDCREFLREYFKIDDI